MNPIRPIFCAIAENCHLLAGLRLKALTAGEGLFLQKISGNGVLFLNSYGCILEKKLAAAETYIVDTGHIVAFESSVQYQLKRASKGLLGSMATGEGLVGE